jgi:hypothetical protein
MVQRGGGGGFSGGSTDTRTGWPLFSEWTGGLVDLDQAYAVLGLGLIPRRLHGNATAALAAVATALNSDDIRTWRFDALPSGDGWARFPPPSTLAGLVHTACQAKTQRFGLMPGVSTLDVWNAVRQLIPRHEVVAHLVGSAARQRIRFRWPLRVGFLPGPNAEAEANRLMSRDSWGGNVYEAFVLSRRRIECDFLMCVEDAQEAPALLELAVRELGALSADLIAVFGYGYATGGKDLAKTIPIRASANAGGVAYFTSGEDPVESIRSLCIELSHNKPIDVALAHSSRSEALLIASHKLLEASVLGSKVTTLATALESRGQADIVLDPDKFGRWATAAAPPSGGAPPDEAPPPKGAPPPKEAPPPRRRSARPAPVHAKPPQPAGPTRAAVSDYLRRSAGEFEWHEESNEASDLGRAMRALAEEDAKLSGPRYLQAAFATHKSPEVPLAGGLKPLADYLVNVFVGQEREGYSRAGVAFPDLPPPDDGRAHELDVVFWEPELCKQPVVKKLELPPLGSSGICRFELRTRKNTKSIHARITILHRNRVLQTGTLTARVGPRANVKFELDAIPRRILSGLDERTNFSMALVLNDAKGSGAVHLTAKGKSQTFSVDATAVSELVDTVGSAISDIKKDPKSFAGIRAAGSEELLLMLAAKGRALREYMERYNEEGVELVTPEYVQLVSTKPGKVFPLEFIYDWTAPEMDAKLCPHAEAALASGDCLQTCARHADPANMSKTVCPFGFWGLRCVIERKLHDNKKSAGKTATPGSAEPVSGSRTVLRPLTSVLVAATPKADNIVPTSVSDMLARIRAIDSGAERVMEWAKWPGEVARVKPSTLALVVHQAKGRGGTPQLEIGPPPMLSSDFLVEKFVTAPGSTTPPIVLLIGCETGRAKVSYENFALRFQWRGAALVVSTIAEVVGRQAAPMAAEILEAIQLVKEPTSFAVVMRDVRRKLLAEGTPMVLGLVADGDADWDIVG